MWDSPPRIPAVAKHLLFDGIDSVRTSRIPETSGIGFQVKVVLKPTSSYNGDIPSILEKHSEAMLEYAKSRIYLTKGSDKDAPYFNQKLGLYWLGLYRMSRTDIKASVMRGFGGKQRVRPRRFV